MINLLSKYSTYTSCILETYLCAGPIEEDTKTPQLIKKSGKKTKRFIPRRKYKNWKKIQAAKKNLGLIHNFSDFNLTCLATTKTS